MDTSSSSSPQSKTKSPADVKKTEHNSTLKLSRPFLTTKQIKYCQSKTITDYRNYRQRTSQILNILSGICNNLKLPTRTLESAMQYFQKFYLFNKFELNEYYLVGYASLLLACKNEDTIKKAKDIILAGNPLCHRSTSLDFVEQERKLVLNYEKKILETVSFDFRRCHVQEFLIKFAKKLEIDYEITYLAWIIVYDSFLTEISLKVPPTGISIACLIIAIFIEKNENLLEQFDDEIFFTCDKKFVFEALNDILDFYINNYNYSQLIAKYPENDMLVKFKISLDDYKGLDEPDDKLVQKDDYFQINNYYSNSSGFSRYMLGNRRKRFIDEIED
ncbi:Ctk2p [Ascoidea rubescens DSM 1968]|uniref:Cyclin-like protein n=1 Tax=Ascoidea rubescens DSM 1968 TaxID=1344418 RepID=A0A1D2VFV5_9ASCO|nr:cyclin-like protein [Ascoidea rubescens DSM 1968]ODV60357.1 cyclin-like protein [Ascoidea rubescens DSM 1968]